jgi:hypothetical protein
MAKGLMGEDTGEFGGEDTIISPGPEAGGVQQFAAILHQLFQFFLRDKGFFISSLEGLTGMQINRTVLS